MLFSVVASFIVSIMFSFFSGRYGERLKWLITVLPVCLFLYYLSLFPAINESKILYYSYDFVPSLGVNLSFNIDALSHLFLLLITGIGSLVFIYSTYYLKGHKKLLRFYLFLTMFMGAMIGLVSSNNIITLFVFWELTSISSFYLIGFNNDEKASRKSAMTALSITGLGGLFLLAFGVLAGSVTGTYEIHEMLASPEVFANGNIGVLLFIFILIASITKSAQFPFHFWLPGAMKAPTPVSTYLHSATMVKAGIYLLLRFVPHFKDQVLWYPILTSIGAVTMIYAGYHVLFRKDMKSVLAYSTIAALGVLVFLIGIGTQEAIAAALTFVLVHAFYKAALFLITGIVDHQTGTRDISKLGGLRKVMFPVFIIAGISALSSAGFPPLFGFLGKDLVYEATLHHDNSTLLTSLAVTANVFLVFAGFSVGIKPFVGKLPSSHENTKSPSPILWVPAAILAVGSLTFGLLASGLHKAFIFNGVQQLTGADILPIKLWHGFNFILLLSVVTLLLGTLIYIFWKLKHSKGVWIQKFDVLSPENLGNKIVEVFHYVSYQFTIFIQNGYLRNYVLTMMLVFTGIMSYHVFTSPLNFIHFEELLEITINDIVIVVIMFSAILFSVFSRSRLAAIAGLGIVGYAMCFIFVFYSAPDLAMTQFTIDTLTVILFVLVLYRLPRYLNMSNTKIRIRDGVIAVSLGVMIVLMILEVMNETPNKMVSEFYTENAYVLAKGKNIVNVILVDFRGYDTLIEVIVLSIAAIGVFGLLKLHLKRNEK